MAHTLNKQNVSFESFSSEDDLAEVTATILTQGYVATLHQGRFEWGPRALGNRSIIADPSHADMKERINRKVKFREKFRPFAPAILADQATEYIKFDPAREPLASQFMLSVHPYHQGQGDKVPAVSHCNTGRLQVVGSDSAVSAFAPMVWNVQNFGNHDFV